MRREDYSQNQKKRKDYIQQPGLLTVVVDVSKAKHDAYMVPGLRFFVATFSSLTAKLTSGHGAPQNSRVCLVRQHTDYIFRSSCCFFHNLIE